MLGPLVSSDTATAGDDQSQDTDDEKKKDKGGDDDESVNAAFRLINIGPINLDRPIEEPVTSGNDVDFDLGPPPGAN